MLGIILVLGGMHAAVEALKASGSGFGDVGLDLVDASHGVVTQLNRLMEEFLRPALLFESLIDLLPSAVFFGIDLALAVFRAAALPVDKTLRAVHDGTDAARRVQIALGAGAAGLLRERHAMMADIIQRIGCGKRGNRSKIGHRLHAQSAGNDNNVFRSLGDKACKRFFGLDLVAQEVYLDRTGDVLALLLGNGRKAVALRLFGRVELLEALVAGDNKEVILPGKQAFQLIPVFQHILGIVHQIPPSYRFVVRLYANDHHWIIPYAPCKCPAFSHLFSAISLISPLLVSIC